MSRQKSVIKQAATGTIVFWLTAWGFAAPTLPLGVWTDITPSWLKGTSFRSANMAIDRGNPNNLFLTGCFMSPSGLVRSTDGGSTWAIVGTPPGTVNYGDTVTFLDSPFKLEVDPNNSQHMYCTEMSPYGGATLGFWVTTNGGAKWIRTKGFTDCVKAANATYDVGHFDVDPSDFNHVIVASHYYWNGSGASGILETKDGGNTFIAHSPAAGMGSASKSVDFLYDPTLGIGDGNTWLVVEDGSSMWRTSDAGTTWTEVFSGFTVHGGVMGHYYSRQGVLYVGGYGLNRSSDNGKTWQAVSGAPGGYVYSVTGDGATLYTGSEGTGPAQAWYSALETADTHWTMYNGGTVPTDGVTDIHYDALNNIVYSANNTAGVWALKATAAKPLVLLSSSSISVSYERGQTWTPQTRIVTAVNVYHGSKHLTGPVTISKKSSWLTVSVNAANVDSQVITNTIDPSSFPDVDQKYYDTVIVHAAGAEVQDLTYSVMVWIRQPSSFAAIAIAPSDSGSLPSSKPFQFSAICNDQYGLPLTTQPAVTWSATGGTITQAGLFTPTTSAVSGSVVASSQQILDTTRFAVVNCHPGLAYEYIDNFTGTSVAAITGLTPTKSGTVTNLSLTPATDTTNYAFKFSGYIMIPTTGSYTFYTNSDDGSALYIDGAKIVDSDGPHGAQERSGTVSLSWGLHLITVLYFQAAGNAALTASWEGPNIAKAAIPDSVLFYGSASTVIGGPRAAAFSACLSNAVSISVVGHGLLVKASAGTGWQVRIFNLDGTMIARRSGAGTAMISFDHRPTADGCIIVKLHSGNREMISKVLLR